MQQLGHEVIPSRMRPVVNGASVHLPVAQDRHATLGARPVRVIADPDCTAAREAVRAVRRVDAREVIHERDATPPDALSRGDVAVTVAMTKGPSFLDPFVLLCTPPDLNR